jgi:hypothetical protein
MWYNKSKFGFILRKCLNQKYLSDWKDTSESLKDGKLTTKFLTLADMELKRSSLSPLNFGHLVRK